MDDKSEVFYMRRKNLGNYEHAEASVRFYVVGADIDAALVRARAHVETALGIAQEKPQLADPAPAAVAAPVEAPAIAAPVETAVAKARKAITIGNKSAEAPEITPEAMGHALQAKRKALAEAHGEKATNMLLDLVKEYTTGQYYNIPAEQRGVFMGKLEALQ